MSQSVSNKNLFTLSLQEEKFNQIKNISFSSNPLITNNPIGEKYQKSDRSTYELNNQSDNIYRNTIRHNETDFMKPAIEKFKNEISLLKSYINRLNKEIRKKYQNEIPILDSYQLNTQDDIKPNNFLEISKFLSDSFERLLNPDYLNPIFSIYDNHILNLENDLKYHKNLTLKYESKIEDLTKENLKLREKILIQSNDMKDIIETKLQNNTIIPNDEEFFKFLEERNDILSKENEILALNYQKVSKELLDFSLNYNEKYNESINKIELYDRLESEIKRLGFLLEDVMTKNQIYEKKFMALTNELSNIEIEKNNYMILCDQYKAENETLTEANLFYKNFIYRNK